MINSKEFLIGCLLLLRVSFSYRIGVISDVHVNSYYKETTSDNNCWGTQGPWESIYEHPEIINGDSLAPYGRLGCDAPFNLIQIVLEDMKKKEPQLDLILFLGDAGGHGIPIEKDKGTGDWNLLQKQIKMFSQEIVKHYPNINILQVAGNDDLKYHSQCPTLDETEEYYGFMFNTWFTSIPKNAQSNQLSEIKETFMKGGYYRFDVDSNLAILGINTLYYASKNDRSQQGTVPDDQIAWFEEQLSNIKDQHKFILILHYYPAVAYEDGVKEVMQETYITQFRDILMANYHRVIVILGGHEHLADLRYHSSDFTATEVKFETWERNLQDKYFYYNFIENPSISPNKGNNPGYGILEVDDYSLKPENYILHYFQLSNTYNSGYSYDQTFVFYQVDLKANYGLPDLTPDSFSDFKNRLVADDSFLLQFLSNKFGFFQEDQTKCIKNLYQDDMKLVTSTLKTYKYICYMHKSIFKSELKNCVDSK